MSMDAEPTQQPEEVVLVHDVVVDRKMHSTPWNDGEHEVASITPVCVIDPLSTLTYATVPAK